MFNKLVAIAICHKMKVPTAKQNEMLNFFEHMDFNHTNLVCNHIKFLSFKKKKNLDIDINQQNLFINTM
jgi:hypothetical protein